MQGMMFIHKSVFHSHGRLTSAACCIDSRWVLKIGDFGLDAFHDETSPDQVKLSRILFKQQSKPLCSENSVKHLRTPSSSWRLTVDTRTHSCTPIICRTYQTLATNPNGTYIARWIIPSPFVQHRSPAFKSKLHVMKCATNFDMFWYVRLKPTLNYVAGRFNMH
jgi:hypothetical protein